MTKVAEERYYTNADRSKLVKEGSPEAAFLVVAEGGEVTAEMTGQYGIKGVEREEQEAQPGIVTSAVGDSNEQGFVPASAARAAGTIVTADDGGESAPAETPTKTAAKAPAKKGARK